MRKYLLVVLALLLFASVCFAGTKTLTATWQQAIPTENDLAGWKLYKATVAGGPYTLDRTIPYVSQQTTYTSSAPITVPDGQLTTLYFVLSAFDTSGNESGKSNEVQVQIDFLPPGNPFQLIITITTP